MKKALCALATLSILASSLLFAQSASAIGPLYSTQTRSGDVRCSGYGFFTVAEGVVTRSEDCYGVVIIPSGVTAIGNDGFSYSSIDSVTIPSSVLRIGDRAFERARYLSAVITPNSVTALGRDAFRDAEGLISATLGTGITAILPNTFRNARALTSITIPNSVTEIGSSAFAETLALTSITIPNSVTRIGDNAFTYPYSGYGLTSITIPNSVTELGEGSFRGASMLTSVTLGNGISTIRANTFYGASSLTSITIPNSVTEIASNAFQYANLTEYRYCGTLLTVQALTDALGDRTNTCTPSTATITAGQDANSKVATFSRDVKIAQIPATNALPAIKLDFLGTAPSSVKVRPTTNPASPSATPFMTTGSPKIVEIEVPSGHDGSDVKICLDGASTDNLYHYTGGRWVELLPRTYVNNQVCGITNSFSPFVAAPVNPVTSPGAPTIGTATATGTSTATISFTAPASDGGSTILKYTATSTPGSIAAEISQAGSGTISVTGLSAATSYTFTVTATNSAGTSVVSTASNSITTFATGVAPLFSSGSSYDGRFTVQIKDYDQAFTYTVTASEGTVSVNATGLITVNGLRPDQSVTVNVTTTRAGYASGTGSITGRSQVAPMLPGTRPTLTITDTLITCTIGSYSATPTSSAFSLFVDGKHVSTIFSALGEYLPDWIIPWATSSSITRTALLTSATWAMSDTYKGKSITCTTLAYSKNAIGLTSSEKMMVK
jgi:hypothetical protein